MALMRQYFFYGNKRRNFSHLDDSLRAEVSRDLVPQIGTVVGRQVEGSLTHCDSTLLPHAAVEVFGYVLPWLETSIGLLTLVGVLPRPALVERGFIDRSTNTRNTLRQDWEQGCS